jgi:hypothetical protein
MNSTARATSVTIRVAGIVGGALLLVGVVAFLFLRFVFTPTITLQVTNDSSGAVQVSSCGSDPVLLSVGATGPIDPNPNDPRAACLVYSAVGTSYLGCLSIPRIRYKDGDTVRVSWMDAKVAESTCGS